MRILIIILTTLLTSACCFVGGSISDDVALYKNSRVLKPIIFPKELSEKFPKISKEFMRAVHRWEISTPVEFYVSQEIYGPRGSISVGIGFYPTMLDPEGKNTLGFYNPAQQYLFFNENLENSEDESVYKTCLHELGHVLGLPHIIGKIDEDGEKNFVFGGAYDIVLPTKAEAKKCIMYPISCDEEQDDLTEIEILWVRHALMHDINLTSFVETCIYEKN